MYHYIRNNEEHPYDCYSRRKDEFISQINLFKNESEIVNPSDLDKLNFYLSNEYERAFLLTFDDGYKDHLFCSEYLSNNNLSAVFFPPINSIEGELLDVNAIHILLGTRGLDKNLILNEIKEQCRINSIKLSFDDRTVFIDEYIEIFENKDSNKYKIADLWINQIIKKILQRDIINNLERKELCELIFKKFTQTNPYEEANNLYLSKTEMIQMKELGMFFGSHGLNHLWLSYLNKKDQFDEIKKSFDYLIDNNLINHKDPAIMCYPFGSYNDDTLSILFDLDFDYSLTTKVGAASTKDKSSIHELSRWDTNFCWDDEFRKPILPMN